MRADERRPCWQKQELQDTYNELYRFLFNDKGDLVVRAHDEGVASSLCVTSGLNGEITTTSEDAIFNFASTS